MWEKKDNGWSYWITSVTHPWRFFRLTFILIFFCCFVSPKRATRQEFKLWKLKIRNLLNILKVRNLRNMFKSWNTKSSKLVNLNQVLSSTPADRLIHGTCHFCMIWSEKVEWKQRWSLKRKEVIKSDNTNNWDIILDFFLLYGEKLIGSCFVKFWVIIVSSWSTSPVHWGIVLTPQVFCLFPRFKKKTWRRLFDHGLYFYQLFPSPLETPCDLAFMPSSGNWN